MRRFLLACLLFVVPMVAFGQVGGHYYVPSTTDSSLGQTNVIFTADGDCDITASSHPNCTAFDSGGFGPSAPYSGTLVITSTVSLTATRTLTVIRSPGRGYVTWNETTGAQGLSVGGASGTKVTVANSASVPVALCTDGTNYASCSPGGSGTIGGTVSGTRVFTESNGVDTVQNGSLIETVDSDSQPNFGAAIPFSVGYNSSEGITFQDDQSVVFGKGAPSLSFSGLPLNSIGAPSASDDAATKGYVDTTTAGFAPLSGRNFWTNSNQFAIDTFFDSNVSATSGANVNSPMVEVRGSVWQGTSAVTDQWWLQDIIGAGTNGTSTLTFTHGSGTSGAAIVALPALSTVGGSPICTTATGCGGGGGSGTIGGTVSGTGVVPTSNGTDIIRNSDFTMSTGSVNDIESSNNMAIASNVEWDFGNSLNLVNTNIFGVGEIDFQVLGSNAIVFDPSNTGQVNNLTDCSNAHDACNKEYVDARGIASLTTTGTSGPATYSGGVLNIPNYASGGFTNPMTTLGDLIYGGASGTATRLAGFTVAGIYNLCETPTGSSVAPTWCNSPITIAPATNQVLRSYSASTGLFTQSALASGDIPNNAANTSGTASNLSGTPVLPNGVTTTTQAVADNSTKLATTAYADRAAGNAVSGVGFLANNQAWTAFNEFQADTSVQTPTNATSMANQNSPKFQWLGAFWNGTVGFQDAWTAQEVLGAGTNPTSTLIFLHSGTPGVSSVAFPSITQTGSYVSTANAALNLPAFSLTGSVITGGTTATTVPLALFGNVGATGWNVNGTVIGISQLGGTADLFRARGTSHDVVMSSTGDLTAGTITSNNAMVAGNGIFAGQVNGALTINGMAGSTLATPGAATNAAFTVTMANASATGDLLDLKNSAGTQFSVDHNGDVLVNKVNVNAARKGMFICTAAGTIAISNTNELITSDVIISLNTAGGTITTAPAMKTVTSGTGFTVICGATDTSTYNYVILN